MLEKAMYELELNKSLGGGEWYITRVPGGWIYYGWNYQTDSPTDVGTFVPEPPPSYNKDYAAATPKLKKLKTLLSEQKDLDPAINQIVNDNFWELF